MSTLTLPHRTASSQSLPPATAHAVAAPRRAGAALAQPAGLETWTAARTVAQEQTAALAGDLDALADLLGHVRELADLAAVCDRAGIGAEAARVVVSGVGARIAQMRTQAPAADAPGVIGHGWGPRGKGTPDIRRAYLAVVGAAEADLRRAYTRWASTQSPQVAPGYRHFADLYAVAHGHLPTLAGLSSDPAVQGAYRTAWARIVTAVDAAMEAITELGGPAPMSVAQARGALRRAYWLLPNGTAFAAALRGGDPQAGTPALRQLRRQLAAVLAANPGAYRPASLADLGQPQWRALLAALGVEAESVDTSVKTAREDLPAVLAAAWARLARTSPEVYSAEAMASLSAAWAS